MKVLIISQSGEGLGLAHKLFREGHFVEMFIRDRKFVAAGKGIITLVDNWRSRIATSDLIIGDTIGFGYLENTLKELRVPFLGISLFSDKLVSDPMYMQDIICQSGIKFPATFNFSSPQEARYICDDFPELGVVIKPLKGSSFEHSMLIKNVETFSWMLDNILETSPLSVQYIISGVEVSCQGWFNGRDWISPFSISFAHKSSYGGLYPDTFSRGNVVVSLGDNPLTRSTLLKLTPLLKSQGYKGPVNVTCIVNDQGIYVISLSTHFEYDSIEALLEGLKEDSYDLFFETSLGVKKVMNLTNDIMISVRLHCYPVKEGLPILGISSENIKHLFLIDVYLDDSDHYRYSGRGGVVAKVAARGRDINEARSRVYRTISNLAVYNAQYDSNIGAFTEMSMRKLRKWGYI